MNAQARQSHPEPEALAAFLSGRLMGSELEATTDHLRGCGECREIVGEAAQFEREERAAADDGPPVEAVAEMDSSAASSTRSRWWLAAAAVLVIAIGGAYLARIALDPMRALQPGGSRSVEARLTQFAYAPYSPQRAANDGDDWKRMAAAGKLRHAVDEDRSAENLHRYALAELALGKAETAVELLIEAARLAPNDARILSDLSAAYLAADRPADAAETAAKALDHDSTLAPAAFNRALSLEALFNRSEAERAWERYLQLDPSGPWAGEARKHLDALHAPRKNWNRDKADLRPGASQERLREIVGTYPQRVRVWIQNELLPRWVMQRQMPDLQLLETLASARETNGDPYLADLAVGARTPSPDFVAGVLAWRDARAALAARQFEEAVSRFDRAEAILERARSPLALAAALAASTNDSYEGHGQRAVDRLDTIQSRLARYPSLASEAAWIRGLMCNRRSEHARALRFFSAALTQARLAHETEHEVVLAELMATELDELADTAEADRYRVEVLRRVDEIDATPQRRYVAFAETALAALSRGRPRLALEFIAVQHDLATQAGDPLLLAEAATARARALADLGRVAEAETCLAVAREQARLIPAPGLRDRASAEADYVSATMWRQWDPRRAKNEILSAVARWQSNGWAYHAAAAHATLGEIRLAESDVHGAETEFRAGLDDIERERSVIEEPQLRVAFFDRAEALFERLIDLLIDMGHADEAFAIAERKRARALLDNATATEADVPSAPLDLSTIRAALPQSATIVELTLVPRGAVIWLVDRQHVVARRTAATADEIRTAVARHRDAISRDDRSAVRREGAWLFSQLIAPVAGDLPPGNTLVVVPDGALLSLPFAALVRPDGTFLVEENPLLIAPSASLLIHCMAGRFRPAAILAVAQPAPRDLPRLEGARREVQAVQAMYPGAEVWYGSALGPDEFLRRSAGAGLIIFAGHATPDALVFESSQSRPPLYLTAKQVASARLPERPLVVLAGCDTGAGSVRATEGLNNLATAFLGAGARSVIATAWNVDDESLSRLLEVFYGRLREGSAPVEALRSAQLSMLRSPSRHDQQPASWAGVFLIGSF